MENIEWHGKEKVGVKGHELPAISLSPKCMYINKKLFNMLESFEGEKRVIFGWDGKKLILKSDKNGYKITHHSNSKNFGFIPISKKLEKWLSDKILNYGHYDLVYNEKHGWFETLI